MECRGSRGCGSSMNIKSKSKVGINQGKAIHNCPEVPWKKERKLSKNEDLAHKFFKSTKEGHFASSCPCKIDDEATLPRKTSRINKRKCYGYNEKGREIGFCPHKKDDHCNQSSKRQTGNKQVKKQDKSKTQLCYNCRVKGHIGKNCPIGNIPKPNLSFHHNLLRKAKNGTCATRVISSLHASTKAIWVPKYLVTNFHGPNMIW
uniref:CCHC-type domain-containing protein n=1 Tax=Oryza glumipatula TaxID=40148 RepID=A0A0D9ZKL1_9ORYZ